MSLFKKIADASIWVIFVICFILAILAFIARNAVPGDALFGLKLAFEQGLLASSKLLNKQVDVEIGFVSKRFNETTRVISSKYASESLNRLDTQVEVTANEIAQIEDPTQRQEAANKYIAELSQVSNALTQEKQKLQNTYYQPPTTIKNNTGSYSGQTTTTNIAPTNSPQVAITSPQAPDVSQQIDNTQQTIQQTIDQMTQISTQSTTDIVAPTSEPPTPTTPPEIPTVAPTAAPTQAPATVQSAPEPTATTAPAPSPTPKHSFFNNGWGNGYGNNDH